MSNPSSHTFALDPRLVADTLPLAESSLSLLLLMNERRYPWLILVPKCLEASELYHLNQADRVKLLDESCLVARTLSETFGALKINTGALGNIVRQLHVHHVARFADDPAWPGPVWGHSPREPYSAEAARAAEAKLRSSALANHFAWRA